MNRIALPLAAFVLFATLGCDRGSDTTQGPTSPPSTAPQAGTAANHSTPADHPNRVELGVKQVGGLELKAIQDEPIQPGGEAAFDLLVTGGKPKAVRFWVGTEDAKGSVKAKAEEETPNNWHTHTEVPNPLPPDSKFWVEIEPPSGQPFKASFDLKMQ